MKLPALGNLQGIIVQLNFFPVPAVLVHQATLRPAYPSPLFQPYLAYFALAQRHFHTIGKNQRCLIHPGTNHPANLLWSQSNIFTRQPNRQPDRNRYNYRRHVLQYTCKQLWFSHLSPIQETTPPFFHINITKFRKFRSKTIIPQHLLEKTPIFFPFLHPRFQHGLLLIRNRTCQVKTNQSNNIFVIYIHCVSLFTLYDKSTQKR